MHVARAMIRGLLAAVAAVAIPAVVAFAVGAGPFPAGTAAWAFLAGLAAAAGLEAAASGEAGAGPAGFAPSRLSMVLGVLTGLTVIALAVCAFVGPGPASHPATFATGLGLMTAGAVLRVMAIRRLGVRFRSDDTVGADAELERGGVYRRLAHPSEVGLTLIGLGGACLLLGPVVLGLVVVLYGLQTWRLHLEERALFRRYGPVYVAYRRGTFDPWPSVVLIAGGRTK